MEKTASKKNKERKVLFVVDKEYPQQISDVELKHLFEEAYLKNITSLIDKCKSDSNEDIPNRFENITITCDEYNTLLHVRARLKSLIEEEQ